MHLYFNSFFKMFIDLFYTSFQRLISEFLHFIYDLKSTLKVCFDNIYNKELTITLYLIVTDSLFKKHASEKVIFFDPFKTCIYAYK